MFCSNCGNKLDSGNEYCPKCGKKVNNSSAVVSYDSTVDKGAESKRTASIVLGCLSLFGVFVLVLSPISLILALVGLVLAIKANHVVKNTAGIVLNAIGLFLSFIIVCILALVIIFSYNIIRTGPVDYGNMIDNFIEENTDIEHDF